MLRSLPAITHAVRALRARVCAVLIAGRALYGGGIGYASMDELSHALQSPLTVLKSELGMLRSGMHEPTHEVYERLEQSVDRMSHLVRMTLDLSRETAIMTEEGRTCDASALLCQILEYVQIMADDKDISLSYYIPLGISVRLPKHAFEEVVTNVISNALRYTADCPRRTITISLTRNGSRARLTVDDSGVGIPPEELPHIYRRYYRSGNAKARHGTGLGLTLVRRAIETYGGSIGITSTVGVGTSVIVYFPATLPENAHG